MHEIIKCGILKLIRREKVDVFDIDVIMDWMLLQFTAETGEGEKNLM
jgi:hypothetical protein